MINRREAVLVPVITAALILSACASGSGADTTPVLPPDQGLSVAGQTPPVPPLDADQVREGETIYGRYCSSCHRADLSGDPDWKTRNADGSLRPPPHDTTGHTWHHSDALLLSLTRDGSVFPESRMPSFGGTLTDAEIVSVLEFIKSSWGPEERAFQWQITWREQQATQE